MDLPRSHSHGAIRHSANTRQTISMAATCLPAWSLITKHMGPECQELLWGTLAALLLIIFPS